MKRAHSPWIVAILAIVAGTSVADVHKVARESMPVGRPEAVDLAGLPPECRLFLAIPADSTSELLPWAQRLSVAACRQSIALAPVTDPEQFRPMITRLEQAMQPSIAIYRDAMVRGPVQIQILAAYGLGMTHLNLIVRARSAVRVPGGGGQFGGAAYGGRAYLDRSLRFHQALEALLVKDRDAALAGFHDVARLTRGNPEAERANPVMPVVITDAQRQAALLR
ncbi:MAG TPA: hypothetical protein VF469_05210 [Kofleriaceae bacterium]